MAKPISDAENSKTGPGAIAVQNDWLRHHLNSTGANRVVITQGIAALIGDVAQFRGFHKRAELLRAVRDFDRFDARNDPYGEHDLGSFAFEEARCLWKIDHYNRDLSAGSENPADPFQTVRVITIMLAEER